ncbi:Protein NETWORKED 4B [Vitis vinifera]|nr:Protein NETWORKED 4B [Vitis vinifera]
MAFVSDHDREVESLNAALHNAQENFSLERAQLQSDISSLSKQVVLLETRLEEWRAKEMEMKGLHEAQETVLLGEIEQLKAELSERGDIVQALNKNLDALKVTYDMLMAEKDELSARVDTLIADVNSWDNQIQQLEDHLRQLRIERVELIAGTESARKLVDELSWRVKELEREVERQRVVISDRAEEKREAIRQLCFSLEHYRSGYQELRQAFIGHKRLPILAS